MRRQKQRLLWVVAHDWPCTGEDATLSREELFTKRRHWLQWHEKKTSGIMGFLPLVKNMTMRLTFTENAKEGAFKNARCILESW